MHRNDGLSKKEWICGVVLLMALFVIILTISASHTRADGEEIKTVDTTNDELRQADYFNSDHQRVYYKGTVTKDDSAVRELPGSKDKTTGKKKDDILKTSTGKQVLLKKGTEVLIFGERSDSDNDAWYHVQVTFNNEVFVGYVFTGRVTRDNTKITFSPTPAPATDTPAPTSTIAPTAGEKQPELKNPTPTTMQQTQEMTKKAKEEPWSIWTFVLILVAAFVSFLIIYMIVNHYAEKKIDEEMRSTPSRDYTLPHLEGESDEDYEKARRKARKKEVARDFKDQRQRKLSDELELDETQVGEFDEFDDFKINMDGVFDEDTDTREAVSAVVNEAVSEDARDQAADAANAVSAWNAAETEMVKNLSDGADEQEKELIRQIVPNYTQPQYAAPEAPAANASAPAGEVTFTPEEMVLRRKLDELKEQDVLVHRKHGTGEVIDNSDPNVIQVRFGRDLHFLKKDKLVKRKMVEL